MLSYNALSRAAIPLIPFVCLALATGASRPFDPFSISSRCPFSCSGDERASWAHYHDLKALDACDATILFDLNLYNTVDGPATHFTLRGCTVGDGPASDVAPRQLFSPPNTTDRTPVSNNPVASNQTSQDIQILGHTDPGGEGSLAAIAAAASALADHVSATTNGQRTVLFAKQRDVLLGLYAGRQLDKASVSEILQLFANSDAAGAKQGAAQVCDEDSLGTEIFGVFADTTGDLAAVQSALRDWNDAKCLKSLGVRATLPAVLVAMVPGSNLVVGPTAESQGNSLVKRAVCQYTQVVPGDGCWALADRCGITIAQLEGFNNIENFCDTLQAGQYVCCSAGDLPDFSPQPNPDGSCFTYTVQPGDFCFAIAEAHSITADRIEELNLDTWGWAGCGFLLPGQIICLSTGTPPMPAAIENAVCGPQVPGTSKPADMSTLADLNPCPLNVCCNVWGQCGTTDDFCIPSPADTGAPGTATPGSNGCISSCGMEIINNESPPAEFIRIGYWEAWNHQRPCLHMRPRHISSKYTHLHFAFGGISEDFGVELGSLRQAFTEFKALTGVKRVMSFGGWSFSTEHDTYPIFREGVTPAQRQAFANNVAAFIVNEGLDGVDFDWEYPGAPDIPGIPPGSPSDGPNYLAFLQLVRAALPSDKTIGIAAPASYWYLKGFPIDEIADVVDYIVYMTYDLHGQWDYGNQWATPGCPAGNCLRSHVNKTETENALAMVTKAGVNANKLIIGMALYGRSFQMTTPGCHGPDCTYTGPDSGATPGRCTGTSGYISSFEIREIIATNPNIQTFTDEHGDILVYDNVQWVSWLSAPVRKDRIEWVRSLNFGGTVEWAVDLDEDYGNDEEGDNGSGPVFISPDIYNNPDPVIACEPPCSLVLPPFVLPTPTTISRAPATISFEENWSTTLTIDGAVITTSAASITSTVIALDPVTTTVISLWNEVWRDDDDDDAGVIWLTPSVSFPPTVLTQTSRPGITRPLLTWTYSPFPWPTPEPEGDDDEDPIPPPPPPPGFPSTIRVTRGPPQPTCLPGQHCGGQCTENCNSRGGGGGGGGGCPLICGCIGPFCAGGSCIGPGCFGGGGGGDGEGEQCRKQTTVSFCEVECSVLEYPASTSTRCEEEDCTRTISGCSLTGSTTTTTTTFTCPNAAAYTSPSPNDEAPILGEDVGMFIGGSPDPEPTATPTQPSEPEIPTTPPSLWPYCFGEHNGDNRWLLFSQDEANSIISSLCSTAEELSPSNSFGYAVRSSNNILASVTWAQDQTGCQPKSAVPIFRDDWCRDTLRELLQTCDPLPGDTGAYGGAFVDNYDYGCVRWWIGRDSTDNNLRMAGQDTGTTPTLMTESDAAAHAARLDALEPEMPRWNRTTSQIGVNKRGAGLLAKMLFTFSF